MMYFNYCGEHVEHPAGHRFAATDPTVRPRVPRFEDTDLIHAYPEAAPSSRLGWQSMWTHYAAEDCLDKVFVGVKNIWLVNTLQRLVGMLAPSVLIVYDNGAVLVFRTVRGMVKVLTAANRRTHLLRAMYCEYAITDLNTPRKMTTAEELIIQWVTGKSPSQQRLAYRIVLAEMERELEELERDRKEE